MKTLTITAILLFTHLIIIRAQNPISVQNGGVPSFYLQVDSAIIHSQDGDTIYIPGGNWYINQWITKRLYIIGVGHNPDSTQATFPTTLIGGIMLSSAASHGSLTGVIVSSGVQAPNESVNPYTVSRCKIGSIFVHPSCSNFIFTENIIEGGVQSSLIGSSATNFLFFNNIFYASFCCTWTGYIPIINSIFKNNIFLYSPQNLSINTDFHKLNYL
jgi:hypothetical protein